jgi:hypothetical protein
VLALQRGQLVLGGRRPVGDGGSGRHGRMASQGPDSGQTVDRSVRRTVGPVGERCDERYAAERVLRARLLRCAYLTDVYRCIWIRDD